VKYANNVNIMIYIIIAINAKNVKDKI